MFYNRFNKTFNFCFLTVSIIVLCSFNFGNYTFPLSPGVVYEIEVKDHSQSVPKSESIQYAVEGKYLKMGIPSSENGSSGEMIFRADKGTIGELIITDDREKAYYKIDESFGRDMANHVDRSQNMIDDMLKDVMAGMTKEQREAVEQITKQSTQNNPSRYPRSIDPQVKSETINTGQRATKLGYPCVKYEVLENGKKVREIWTTDWSNVKGGREAEAGFKLLSVFFEKLSRSLEKFGNFPNPGEQMNILNGFPVIVFEYNELGELELESFLKSARIQQMGPAEFEPPSTYQYKSMGIF